MPVVATAGGLPTRLGKYEILMPLALGGMARIYIGRTTGIGSFERHVVLKLITPERANDHTAVQMFLDEARLAAALNHQNVAQVFEVGEDGGIHYLAMEYVHGQDLRALLAKAGSQGTRVPLELALTVVTGAAAGLNHAHERRGQDGVPLGIVHRDVSPSNIMVGYDGSVKLLDFGIAKATQRSVETQAGIIKGKFAYMAPEQCRGRDVDRRSDVFSLGIILYEITTQHRCFRADSDFDTMHRIVTGDVVRPTRLIQGYPQALEAIVMKALAVDPTQRYQSAGALLEAVESLAVAARMSLSTMSLGRFMRDMFGDLTEPWLTQQGRATQQPQQPRESTISNTNGTGSDVARALDATTRPPVELSPQQLHSARSMLDLPTPRPDESEPGVVEWNAKSYPALEPEVAPPPMEPEPRHSSRPSSPALPVYAHPPVHAPIQVQLHPLPTAPHHPPGASASPVQRGLAHNQIPQGAFAPGPGSGSGPSHQGMTPTREGYTSRAQSRGDVSYPPQEPPPESVDDQDPQPRPNRRPLYIGLGIAAAGLIVLLAMTLGRGSDDAKKQKPIIMDDHGSDNGSTDSGPKSVVEPNLDRRKTDLKPDAKTDPKADPMRDPKPVPSVKADAKGITATGSGTRTTDPPKDKQVTNDTKKTGADPEKTSTDTKTTGIDTRKNPGTASTTVKTPSPTTTTVKTPSPMTTTVKSPTTTTVKNPNPTTTTTVKHTNNTATPPKKKDCQPPAQYNPLDERPVCK